MNFAVNGRHLADQDYTICMRQEEGKTITAGVMNCGNKKHLHSSV